VQFKAPVRAGDVLEIRCELTRAGTRSRVMDFAVYVVARGAATDERPGAAADLGVDRVFGRGTTPAEVASYLVHALTAQEDAA